ncbi:TPA: aspartate aminotransferase family protein [Candidatus Woesearchaeota archaeon]|nr:Acetylornithine aminotransferase [archaeon GW2011_AR15]MBS3103379.1 aspartate aminotransferase family protein [Candidatus Woesearchaeota archaeon]HIH41496.1 aspartate aminotransferase family protein [Candidatus Woesearchaeota archaeon]
MDYEEMAGKYIAPTYGSRGLTIVKGKGIYVYDETGKKYYDCFSNMGVNILGHNIPEINRAVAEQLERITNLHGSFTNDKRSLIAKKLIEVSPKNLTKVFFSNTGTESVEAAIKFSRLATGKTEIIAAKMGYHGKTIGALSLTSTLKKYNEPYEPLLQDVKHFSFNDIDSLKEVISEKTAAVFLEPIQGEGGIRIPGKDFFVKVKKLCEQNNALLVIDEIQSGMGRTGKLFAIEHFNVEPDMICMAKGIASGLPMGAVLITEEISSKLFSGAHTNTFGGNPLVCAASLATFDYIEKHRILENAASVGKYFIEQLRTIESPVIREVRGLGLMIAVELKTKNTKYAKDLQDKGVIIIPTGTTVLRFLPPLIFTKKDVDEVVKIVRDVLSS